MQQLARIKLVGLWLVLGAIAAGVCALTWPQAHLGDEYLPAGIDSFYHARRILDTAADPSSFYEFDKKIHAPEGSLLTWPWGYDYAMGWLVRLAGYLPFNHSPMATLAWIPVAAVFISIGLLMIVARRLRLSWYSVVLAALCLGLSPLTQFLHGVGVVDHHFAEYIFVLATLALGLGWFAKPADRGAAIALGVLLGAAPAIHNGLFILQVPILLTLFAFWLQGIRVPLRTTLAFSAALLVATVLVLLPSLPFRLGRFEYYTLSWFHLYIAVGTAATALAFASFANTKRNMAIIAAGGLVLLLPLVRQVLLAESFLVGKIARLEVIVEMRSLEYMAVSPRGRQDLSLMYSLLVWLLPLTTVYCAIMAWKERAEARVFFWICCLLGIALMFTQMRLHYFGSYAMYLPLLVLAEQLAARWPMRRKAVMLSTALALLLAYWIPARYQLTSQTITAADDKFRSLRPILGDLQKACAKEPGIVLADNDAGHYIRYYTQCSVIANNFLLTRQHEDKIREIDHLTSLSAEALPAAAPYVRYLLLRPISISNDKDGVHYISYSQDTPRLLSDLLLKPVEQIPARYELIEQANIRNSEEKESVPYIRLFRMKPDAEPAAPLASSSLNPAGP